MRPVRVTRSISSRPVGGRPSVRRSFIAYWGEMVRSMGFQVFEEQFTSIRGTRNQPLYWLALLAKHAKAAEFWEKIRHIDPQRGLDF